MSKKRYTSASELVRLSGLSRERVNQLLQEGRLAGAYLEPHGTRGVWRIPVASAERWLADRGVKVRLRWLSAASGMAIGKAEAALQAALDKAVWVALDEAP